MEKKELKERFIDEKTGIEYVRQGDYYIPNLVIPMQEKIQLDYQVNWLKANSDKTYKERQMDIEEKRTEVEIMQLRDGNPFNDKIKDM